jgi:hypothetical protein
VSLQDDHFDLEAFFDAYVKIAPHKQARDAAVATRAAYSRVWEEFVDMENELEKLRPVVQAATLVVRYVIETHYQKTEE